MLKLVGSRARLDLDDPALQLTADQRLAMATDRELVVTAGAGTGKTHTLALRYVALLLELANDGIDQVERVLVLTFTEKAAAEMTERCRARLAAVARAARDLAPELDAIEAGRGEKLVGALDAMVDGFDRARIGTFHGFCARLVREHPAETRTPPAAVPLDPVEAGRRATEALEGALAEYLEANPDDVGPLLDAFGTRRGLLEAGRIALDRLSVLEDVLWDHAMGRITLEDQVRRASPTPAEAADWLRTVGVPSLGLLARLVAPAGSGPFVDQILKPVLAAPDPGADPLAIYGRYREVLDCLMTDEGTLRRLDHASVLGKRDRWADERRFKMAREAAVALTVRLGDWEARARAARRLPTSADRALLEALGPFARWVLAAAEALARSLDRDRVLTFEELQRRVVRAVEREAGLRATLRERFRYLMVDEFQDTDEAQWSLVRALGRADPRVPEDRIFVVGDPKQAIYGFRGGDVTVFEAASRELGAEPVLLSDNFRSRPELISWFNEVFPKVLAKDTPYAPLRAGRASDGGEVTLIRTGDGPRDTARYLAALLRDPDWHDRARFPSPPLAILLRARTHQPAYEVALRDFGVPYVVVGGVGLWSRPEVLDLVNLVAAVAHGDPISIVGTLRGPLIGLPDDHVTVDPRPLAQWEALARGVSPAALVRRIAHALVPALSAADPSGRAEANLALIAAQVDRWDGLGLAEVAGWLLNQVDSGARAAEATLVPAAARVVLCTVHAAKGLEFPVVVVPELHRWPRSDLPALLVARTERSGRFGIASRILDPDAPVETRVEPGRYSTLLDAFRTAADAEDRRLLYVAATRARDRLVFVGEEQDPAEPGARGSWMQRLIGVLPRTTRTARSVPSPPPLPPPEDAPPPRLEAPPLPRRRELELPASALGRFAGCPARWMRGELLGIPESPASARPSALAAARGRALHGLARDGLLGDPDAVRTRWRVEAQGLGALPDERERGEARILAQAARVAADPHVAAALAAPGWSEVPFRVAHAGVVLHGRIDRLYLARDGFVALDWTGEALDGRSPDEVLAEAAPQLLARAWAADRILRERGQPGVVRAEVYLTEIGRAAALEVGDRLESVPALLGAVAETAERGWSEVEARSTAGDAPRPCASCGYRGRPCRGVAENPSRVG